MITLTVSKDRICKLVWKKEKLFRASLNKMVMQLKRKKIHLIHLQRLIRFFYKLMQRPGPKLKLIWQWNVGVPSWVALFNFFLICGRHVIVLSYVWRTRHLYWLFIHVIGLGICSLFIKREQDINFCLTCLYIYIYIYILRVHFLL